MKRSEKEMVMKDNLSLICSKRLLIRPFRYVLCTFMILFIVGINGCVQENSPIESLTGIYRRSYYPKSRTLHKRSCF